MYKTHLSRLTIRTGPLIVLLAMLIGINDSSAGPMINDPKGFHDIPWGTALSSRQDLETSYASPPIVEYLRKEEPGFFAGAQMTSIRYISLEEQFARVIIRYQGAQVHREVLRHLENRFGEIERIPGQMARGLTQQYNWRGTDTEINLTYHASTERGHIFIDSRTLAPRFIDFITDSAE